MGRGPDAVPKPCPHTLQVAAKALETGMFGAYFNVLINLRDITDDKFKDQVSSRCSAQGHGEACRWPKGRGSQTAGPRGKSLSDETVVSPWGWTMPGWLATAPGKSVVLPRAFCGSTSSPLLVGLGRSWLGDREGASIKASAPSMELWLGHPERGHCAHMPSGAAQG